jgi:predicted helicase
MEVIAVINSVAPKTKKENQKPGKNTDNLGKSTGKKAAGTGGDAQLKLTMEFSEIERAILAKIVKKVGNRLYWDDWAKDIAKIAQTHISRITAILGTESNASEIKAFDKFLKELRADLNDGITRAEAIEMLAQHIITKPVFDALFEGYSFTSNNPVSKAMQGVLDVLNEHNLDKESETLTKFYESVRMRASGITEVKVKQKIIVDLYDKFFKNAFPKLVERLGIVYTPVEVVDFIIKSINEVLHHQFGQTLGDKNVHIIDPFTGTGTFIARLLQSGLITKEQLAYKYQHEIHANEIVLLAYYIAAINIEQIYHDLMGGDYIPFGGICLTDTFALYENEDLATPALTDNSSRRRKQKKLDIRVIFGNPPYSEGQASANDEGLSSSYPHSNSRIKATYAELSERPNVRNLYNSYVRAFRWASDRIGDSGVIGFVSASGFIEKSAMDGMRKTFLNEFNSIHVLNLRGDIRKNMLSKGRAKEGQNIFDAGSMTGISITILVKNPKTKGPAEVFYHDIGDELTTRQKLDKISELESVFGISELKSGWTKITPDEHGDWINQRDNSLVENILMGDKRGDSPKLFDLFSQGVTTARDSWCYSSSKTSLAVNVNKMISAYIGEVRRFAKAFGTKSKKDREDGLDGFIDKDATKISWTRALKKDVLKEKSQEFDEKSIVTALYRPFTKQWLYFNRRLNEYVYKMPALFPDAKSENRVICISGVGARSGFSTLMADRVPDFHMLDTGQCFPLYIYGEDAEDDESAQDQGALFAVTTEVSKKRYAINDEGLAHFQEAYPGEKVTKEDLFYYVYGLLHSPSYRTLYEDNLSKELPRIPRVTTFEDFQKFSVAGRALADLHLNYESAKPYSLNIEGVKSLAGLSAADLHVPSKMKYGKGKNGEKHDRTRITYNNKITVSGVPLEAYEYVVNGRPAIEWVMEKQAVSEHKDSQITNDPGAWANDTMGDPAYSLKLLQRVVTVSLDTMRIVKGLPSLYEDLSSPSSGDDYEFSRSLKPLPISQTEAFYAKLPKWVLSQKASHVLSLNIGVKVIPDDKSIEEFAKATPKVIELDDYSHLTKLRGNRSYSVIAVFPSGASRTIGEIKDGKIELFGYWSLFDPDEKMAEDSLGSPLTLQLNFVVVEVKNGGH